MIIGYLITSIPLRSQTFDFLLDLLQQEVEFGDEAAMFLHLGGALLVFLQQHYQLLAGSGAFENVR